MYSPMAFLQIVLRIFVVFQLRFQVPFLHCPGAFLEFFLTLRGEWDISELNRKKPADSLLWSSSLAFSSCSIVTSSVLLLVLIIVCGQVLQWEFCKHPFRISAQTTPGRAPFFSLQNKDLEGKVLLWVTGTYLLACFHRLPIHLFFSLWNLNLCAQHLEELKRLHSTNANIGKDASGMKLLCF